MTKLNFAIVVTVLLFTTNNLMSQKEVNYKDKVNEYVKVKLSADLSGLTENEKKMLPFLFEAAEVMNEIYWTQAYGDKNELLGKVKSEEAKKLIEINYGPWNRIDGNKPFIEGVGEKPAGANFYPKDMTKEEFDAVLDKYVNKDLFEKIDGIWQPRFIVGEEFSI